MRKLAKHKAVNSLIKAWGEIADPRLYKKLVFLRKTMGLLYCSIGIITLVAFIHFLLFSAQIFHLKNLRIGLLVIPIYYSFLLHILLSAPLSKRILFVGNSAFPTSVRKESTYPLNPRKLLIHLATLLGGALVIGFCLPTNPLSEVSRLEWSLRTLCAVTFILSAFCFLYSLLKKSLILTAITFCLQLVLALVCISTLSSDSLTSEALELLHSCFPALWFYRDESFLGLGSGSRLTLAISLIVFFTTSCLKLYQLRNQESKHSRNEDVVLSQKDINLYLTSRREKHLSDFWFPSFFSKRQVEDNCVKNKIHPPTPYLLKWGIPLSVLPFLKSISFFSQDQLLLYFLSMLGGLGCFMIMARTVTWCFSTYFTGNYHLFPQSQKNVLKRGYMKSFPIIGGVSLFVGIIMLVSKYEHFPFTMLGGVTAWAITCFYMVISYALFFLKFFSKYSQKELVAIIWIVVSMLPCIVFAGFPLQTKFLQLSEIPLIDSIMVILAIPLTFLTACFVFCCSEQKNPIDS